MKEEVLVEWREGHVDEVLQIGKLIQEALELGYVVGVYVIHDNVSLFLYFSHKLI